MQSVAQAVPEECGPARGRAQEQAVLVPHDLPGQCLDLVEPGGLVQAPGRLPAGLVLGPLADVHLLDQLCEHLIHPGGIIASRVGRPRHPRQGAGQAVYHKQPAFRELPGDHPAHTFQQGGVIPPVAQLEGNRPRMFWAILYRTLILLLAVYTR